MGAGANKSEKSYLKSGAARKLAISACFISKGWREIQKAQVIVIRQHTTGNVTMGFYLADLLCAGIKDSWHLFNIPPSDMENIIQKYHDESPQAILLCDYNTAHNVIYEALAYADNFGIEPPPEFALSKMILAEDTEDIPLMDIPLGTDGKPCLAIFPDDPRKNYYLQKLKKNAGEGNYSLIYGEDLDSFADVEKEFEEDEIYVEDMTRDDWTSFIEQIDTEDRWDYYGELSYIYEKCIYQPQVAAGMLAASGRTELKNVKIVFEPLGSENFSEEELQLMQELYIKSSRPGVTRQELQQQKMEILSAITEWPNNHILYGHLTNVFVLLDEKGKAKKNALLMKQKFPNYLFSTLGLANALLDEGKLEEMDNLIEGHRDIASLFPGREKFHFSELLAFHILMANFFMKKGELSHAFMYRKIIEETGIPENYPSHERLLNAMDAQILAQAEKLLKEAKKDKRVKEEMLALLVE